MSNKKDFTCSTCKHKHCDESNPAPYDAWTVEGVPGEPGGVFRSRTCLLPMISDRSHYLIKLHEHYKNGYLLKAGGVQDQPVFYLDAMELISAEISKNVKK